MPPRPSRSTPKKVKEESDSSDAGDAGGSSGDESYDEAPRGRKTPAKKTPAKKPAAKATPAKKTPAKATPAKTPAAKKTSAAASVKKETTARGPIKTYDLPGQKKDTPPELDVLRMFYESAYLENPNSEMAARWCLTHGLVPADVAKKLVTPTGFDALRKANIASKKARPPAAKKARKATDVSVKEEATVKLEAPVKEPSKSNSQAASKLVDDSE